MQKSIIGAMMFGATLALAGCGSGTIAIPTLPPTQPPAVTAPAAPISKNPIIANSVAGAQQALTLLERAALRYTTLPRCGSPGATILCSDPERVQRIKDADNIAFDAVMKARRNEATLDFALSAINAFNAVLP